MENPNVRSRASHHVNEEYASEIGVAALLFLAEDPERLQRFLALSGLGPHNLREAAAEPTFLGAVLEQVVSDERLLVAFAATQNIAPETVTKARDALAGPPPDWP
jgi:hypothetical protein